MVVDTSAMVAILLREPEADTYSKCLEDAARLVMSTITRVELSFVIEGRHGETGRLATEQALRNARIEIAAVSPEQAEMAIEAFRQYGKGRHRAALNIGDCFSYALAKATDLPLLFKGNDFVHTDIRPALTA